MSEQLRLPPHSIDAEQSVLGGLLLNNKEFDNITGIVTDEHFYRDDHRRIFRHIARLIQNGEPADPVTVNDSITSSADKDKTGGLTYLSALMSNTPSSVNTSKYAEIVRREADKRALIALGTELQDAAWSPITDAVELQHTIAKIQQRTAGKRSPASVPAARLDADLDHAYEHGVPPGALPGWPDLNEFYTIAPGQWTLITGIPGHGKSELLDAMMVNLAVRDGWSFSVFSPENQPHHFHMRKLIEKYVGKPFNKGPTDRMSEDDIARGKDWFHEHFRLVDIEKPELLTVLDTTLDQTESMPPERTGIVIDPWNQIDHFRPSSMQVDEYLSWALSRVMAITRKHNIHVFVVAHPKVLNRDKDGKRPIPTPYDISGGAHWFNKADNILCVWRDTSIPGNPEVEVHIQKIKFKHIGKIGVARLRYDRTTGRYHTSLGTVNRMASRYAGEEQ